MVINRAIVERDERSRFPISYLFVCSTLVATSLATFDIEKKHVLIQNNNEFRTKTTRGTPICKSRTSVTQSTDTVYLDSVRTKTAFSLLKTVKPKRGPTVCPLKLTKTCPT